MVIKSEIIIVSTWSKNHVEAYFVTIKKVSLEAGKFYSKPKLYSKILNFKQISVFLKHFWMPTLVNVTKNFNFSYEIFWRLIIKIIIINNFIYLMYNYLINFWILILILSLILRVLLKLTSWVLALSPTVYN